MDNGNFKVFEKEDTGTAYVNAEVISMIASLAACEVKGVAALTGGIVRDAITKVGKKKLLSATSAEVSEDGVSVFIGIIIDMDANIPKVSKAVQRKIQNAIESMTNLRVREVNVTVSNLEIAE